MIKAITRIDTGVGSSHRIRAFGRPIVAKGQQKSNRETKKPKADKNKKKSGVAPASPFADTAKSGASGKGKK
ncbi:hypothetical protein [Parvibaculum lavamentivorans]|uniref:hypothetical protein n=1 Tax=Parvibaculum lavamentivorans TaxID=256618 RepID=UPI000325B3CF|nr:hypothetical protein [Parvibaculum lavamentivorans]